MIVPFYSKMLWLSLGEPGLLALTPSADIVVCKPAKVPRLVESSALILPVGSIIKASNRG